MPLIVKGNYKVGEEIKQAPQPINNQNGTQPVRTMQEIREEASTGKVTIKRAVPVKTESEPEETYLKIEEAELIKHFNKKSSYLSDMISFNIESK